MAIKKLAVINSGKQKQKKRLDREKERETERVRGRVSERARELLNKIKIFKLLKLLLSNKKKEK